MREVVDADYMLSTGVNTGDINDIFGWGSNFGSILQVYETQVGYLNGLRPDRGGMRQVVGRLDYPDIGSLSIDL